MWQVVRNPDRKSIGLLGEEIACEALRQRGYRIVERNWRNTSRSSSGAVGGELDIVARDGEWWVFAEVKTRQTRSFGLPEEAVTLTKARRLAALAQTYLATHELDNVNWRIDVIAIELDRANVVTRLRLIPGVGAE